MLTHDLGASYRRVVSRWVAVVLASLAVSVWCAACGASEVSEPRSTSEDAALSDGGRVDARRDNGPPPDECNPMPITDVPVPAAFADRKSPIDMTSEVLVAAKKRFLDRCAICHGAGGRGDGKGGPYDPPTADLTLRLRAEDYLFWRIAQGGYAEPFCSAMPAFAKSYTERERWELVAYLRGLAGARDASTDSAGADAADAAN